jgi:hypothetical protein
MASYVSSLVFSLEGEGRVDPSEPTLLVLVLPVTSEICNSLCGWKELNLLLCETYLADKLSDLHKL